MSTTEAFSSASDINSEEFEYRPLSMAAIASLVFGLLSALVFIVARENITGALAMSLIPLLGVLLGFMSWTSIRKNPKQLSGKGIAITGLSLSLFGLLGGVGFASYVYATEVPEGYFRTSFRELRPDEVEQRRNQPIPRDVAKLDGKKVFIKGYMRADSTPRRHNIDKFLLVRDNEQCCFGDLASVQFFDQVLVETVDKLTTDYQLRVYRIGGTLKIHPENVGKGVGHPVYVLEADHLK